MRFIGLPAEPIERQTTPQPAVDGNAAILQLFDDRLGEAQEIGPVDRLARLQGGRPALLHRRPGAPGVLFVAFLQLAGELLQLGVVLRQASASIPGHGRTSETQTHAPMISRRQEHERKHPACQRLGFGAKLFVNAAAAFGSQEDAMIVPALLLTSAGQLYAFEVNGTHHDP